MFFNQLREQEEDLQTFNAKLIPFLNTQETNNIKCFVKNGFVIIKNWFSILCLRILLDAQHFFALP